MRKYQYLFVLFSLSSLSLTAQTWVWDTLAPAGNRMVRDQYRNVITFNKDGHVIKELSTNGSLLWSEAFPAAVHLSDITTDINNNMYLDASFSGTISIQGQTVTAVSGNDILLAKFDSEQHLIWLRTISGQGSDMAGGICIEAGNYLLATGATYGNTNFSGNLLINDARDNAFLVRYSLNGNYQTAFCTSYIGKVDDEYGVYGLEVKTDHDNNILLLISGVGKTDVAGTYLFLGYEAYIIKLNHTFDVLWAKYIDDTYSTTVNDMQVAPAGDVVWRGDFDWTETRAGWVKKISSDGSTESTLYATSGIVNDLDIDNGNIYFVVWESDKEPEMPEVPGLDYMKIRKVSVNGTLIWDKTEATYSYLGNENISAAGNSIMVGGYFTDSLHLFNSYADTSASFIAILQNSPLIGITEQAAFSADYSIYPNPSSGQFTIHIQDPRTSSTICIHDVFGNCIYNDKLLSADQTIDLSGYAKGMYFLEIQAGNKRVNKKIIFN